MSGYELVLRSRRVVFPEGERPAAVCVFGGKIAAVLDHNADVGGAPVEDLGGLALLPGLVDTHVHINEPGRSDWEGFACATRAAAAGGVTTIIDMPLNSVPPTVSVAALSLKRRVATGQCYVDVGFWGGAVPGNSTELAALYGSGVYGFKAFLIDSGVPEFPPLSRTELVDAFSAAPALFVVHAEDSSLVATAPSSPRYQDFVDSRPPDAEVSAIGQVIEAARATDTRVHILHLSAASALPVIAAARRAGVRITAETCPHYLTLSAEEVPEGATEFKCCPPIRDAANRDALWQGLADGTIDCVVSDHSPCPPAMKRAVEADFGGAWGGIASLQLGLPLMWTSAAARGFSLPDVVRWMAARTAALVGLTAKGRIAAGYDADLVAFDPDTESVVDGRLLHHRHPTTPYHGRVLRGTVRRTWLRGAPVDLDGPPAGRLLERGA